MANKKNNKNKRKNGKKQQRRSEGTTWGVPGRGGQIIQRINSGALDNYAKMYRNLLLDPCGSDLAHPLYADGSGGILCRFVSTASYGIGATDTGFIWHWTPGAMSNDNHEIAVTGSVLPANINVAIGDTSAPGKGYLPNNVMGYRCVAACATITYTGAELGRSGSIWYGQTLGELVNLGVGYSVNLLQPSLPHNIRTPDIPIDVLWRPSTRDQDWQQPYQNIVLDNKSDRGSITICATGLPAGIGVQIRMTAVYEYQPRYTSGMTVSPSARAKSNNSLVQVLNSIPDHAWSRMGGVASMLGKAAIRSVGQFAQSTAFSLASRAAPMLLTM